MLAMPVKDNGIIIVPQCVVQKVTRNLNLQTKGELYKSQLFHHQSVTQPDEIFIWLMYHNLPSYPSYICPSFSFSTVSVLF